MTEAGYNNFGTQKKNKNIAIIGVGSIVLVAAVVGLAVGVSRHSNESGSGGAAGGEVTTSNKAVEAICQPTDYKETCVNSLSTAGNTTDPKELVKTGFQAAIDQIKEAAKNSTVLKELSKDPRATQALENCQELMDYAIDDLTRSFQELGEFSVSKLDDYVDNLKIWLSGAVTYQQTCLDGFENTTGDAGTKMKEILKTSGELTSNGLAMVTGLTSILANLEIPSVSRRLMSSEESSSSEFPSWMSDQKKRILAATPATVKPNIVVAQDGTGQYKTINDALNSIPKTRANNDTFVIYIKAGIYKEKLMVDKTMTHLMFLGDGPTRTTITGNANFIDGTQTFKTSTVSIVGSDFIAKDIGFENSAGAIKHQAVALRVQSDMSIFYNCQMDGYQDTLYAHAHRQFYRDCTITGTIDFIFGDAAAVFQNCRLVVRKPLDNQQCIVTAQGRTDRREATGLVLQNCTFTADRLLDTKATKSFLGRPWKEFSRTIIMQSQIDDLISPDGWLPWMGTFALDTCFYVEYGNRGAGSSTAMRVKWKGVQSLSALQITDFTVAKFIGGDKWIPPTGVPFAADMMTV